MKNDAKTRTLFVVLFQVFALDLFAQNAHDDLLLMIPAFIGRAELEFEGHDMVRIPAGSVTMGNALGEGYADEMPLHAVQVSAFSMDRGEVNNIKMSQVLTWALQKNRIYVSGAYIRHSESHDYLFHLNANSAIVQSGAHFEVLDSKTNEPCVYVSWYGALAYCNFRSEIEGLTPCYSGDLRCSWNANGYRLPTEAEWNLAACGDMSTNRYPWGDTITHAQANYYSTNAYAYDVSPTRGYHPDVQAGDMPYLSPSGAFGTNAYGLVNMIGNVAEWCWDGYNRTWYSHPAANNADCRGPLHADMVMVKGGHWQADADVARLAYRHASIPITMRWTTGFRCVRAATNDARPYIHIDAPEINLYVTNIASPPSAQMLVWNNGAGSMNYQLSESATWLTTSPTSGVSTGEQDTIDFSLILTGMVNGAYSTQITVASPTAANSPITFDIAVKIITNYVAPPQAPNDMVLIPAGSFIMGQPDPNIGGDNFSLDETPYAHTNSAFYIGKYEVSYIRWAEVRTWSLTNGYSYRFFGIPDGDWDNPVHAFNWYAALKWCNALSEMEGLTPVYYTDNTLSTVYRSGSIDLENDCVNWNANGYRLPTEAEWEFAAHGGLITNYNHYPWPSEGGRWFDHADLNKMTFNISRTPSPHIWSTPRGYYDGTQVPIGPDTANGYGLYDMAGNMMEWCWDAYGTYPTQGQQDYRGVTTNKLYRVLRGGGFGTSADFCRVSKRWYTAPSYIDQSQNIMYLINYGVRIARNAPAP